MKKHERLIKAFNKAVSNLQNHYEDMIENCDLSEEEIDFLNNAVTALDNIFPEVIMKDDMHLLNE